MCDCADKVNAALAPYNTRLDTLTQILPDMSLRARLQVTTEKIDLKKRGRARAMQCAFCPFCGAKATGSAA